jgi:YesN/AraC family two-component response regulator
MRSSPTLDAAKAAEGLDHHGARLVIVDDEEPIRRMLARLLEHDGYECEVASDGEQARSLISQGDFDLVLTDMDMPGISGLDLIMEVSHDHPETATVMITGLDDTTLAHTALEMGAYGYIGPAKNGPIEGVGA